MPRIIYSGKALDDLKRLHAFLAEKDKERARSAIKTIRDELRKIALFPERFRPVENMIDHREAIIDFGSSGYIARFRHVPNSDITIARIRHQLENNFK
ncbi:MAG: type II toxin-antitoxin system RelE/ParE family toxin [Zoogloeaceae bacterium]|jgi:plasmid stabilization system protein ParE|nr:type II toxin-antitoxin system RelE/ParE family toxin [Zoogloeaceae bacterium]